MITLDFITALFYEVDEQLRTIPKHPDAHLWPSEVVTLGLLHALKGVGNRPFYRWLTRDYRPLFPRLPERTRLFRLLKTHQDWTQVFLAAPTGRGIIDPAAVDRLLRDHADGRTNGGDRIWSLLNLELWHRTFIDNEGIQTLPHAHSLAEDRSAAAA